MKKFVFTMTTGRSGTAYLAELARINAADSTCYHEITGWDRFGVDTPDISHLAVFNSQGNTQKIKDFWKQKIDRIVIDSASYYCETSHLLMKSGLMENLNALLVAGEVHIVEITRDPIETAKSFFIRNDFQSNGNTLMWYLDPRYPKNLINGTAISATEQVIIWYIYEIRARSTYYREYFKHISGIKFHCFDLNRLSTAGGSSEFLKMTGANFDASRVRLPPPQNTNATNVSLDPALIRRIESAAAAAARLDVGAIGAEAARNGPRF